MDNQPESTFTEFIRYNNWANQQVLAACQDLSEEQLATPIPGAYGTIRATLEHILRAEAGYVRRLTGLRLQAPFKWEDKPGLPAMAAYAAQVGDALLDVAQNVSPTALVPDDWDGKDVHYHARAIFIQIIDHGIEHRTNITTILNQGLGKPPNIDGWGYLETHPDRFDMK